MTISPLHRLLLIKNFIPDENEIKELEKDLDELEINSENKEDKWQIEAQDNIKNLKKEVSEKIKIILTE